MQNAAKSSISDFWDWFCSYAEAISADVENQDRLIELDRRVLGLAPGLSWEIGPGKLKPWQLVISPNLDHKLRETSRSIVAQAPNLDNWEFYSARQPKDWKYKFELRNEGNAEKFFIDASNWDFVLLSYPDGDREIILKAPGLRALSDEERWHVGAIVLESVLGEDAYLESVGDFELVDEFETQFSAHARPIQLLRAALMGKEC